MVQHILYLLRSNRLNRSKIKDLDRIGIDGNIAYAIMASGFGYIRSLQIVQRFDTQVGGYFARAV